jgi:heme oxygenase
MKPLREATQEKHKQAEQMPFNQRMLRGELSKEEYMHYILQQYMLFLQIENHTLPHQSLKRADRIFSDIEELTEEVSVIDFKMLNSTGQYITHLAQLSSEDILPHIYLNYLALMFGGQMMKSKVPSKGEMYDFDDMDECVQSIRSIQKDEWADEVNKGFQYIIDILDELDRVHNREK